MFPFSLGTITNLSHYFFQRCNLLTYHIKCRNLYYRGSALEIYIRISEPYFSTNMYGEQYRERTGFIPQISHLFLSSKKIQYPEIRCILKLWWKKKKRKKKDLGWINMLKLDTHYLYSLQNWLCTYRLLYTMYKNGLNIFLEEIHGLNLFTKKIIYSFLVFIYMSKFNCCII